VAVVLQRRISGRVRQYGGGIAEEREERRQCNSSKQEIFVVEGDNMVAG
jgi:hypothetical protein